MLMNDQDMRNWAIVYGLGVFAEDEIGMDLNDIIKNYLPIDINAWSKDQEEKYNNEEFDKQFENKIKEMIIQSLDELKASGFFDVEDDKTQI